VNGDRIVRREARFLSPGTLRKSAPPDLVRAMPSPGTLLLDDMRPRPAGGALLFEAPREIIRAHDAVGAMAALARLEAARAEGLWAAGYLAYELGYVLEERLAALLPERSETPLVWFGLYDAPRPVDAASWLEEAAGAEAARIGEIAPTRTLADYVPAFEAIKDHIAAGDTYQVNLTLKARFGYEGSPTALYRALRRRQPVAFGALIECGDHAVLSLSPELFVENRGGLLRARPMKGTMARGRTLAEDEVQRRALAADVKNRAENLMIVDLLRNDLGRVAAMGSVKVTDLFTVETYPSLHQLTSGITARLREGLGLSEVLAALFPCGSITGAPKIAAMEIIAAQETGPRGVYTGAIGYFAPDGDFSLSVAIRTLTLAPSGTGEIGIGGGIVADSAAGAEYEEALLKLKFLRPSEPVALIETLLWRPGESFVLLGRHLERLAQSAAYFGIALAERAAQEVLSAHAAGYTKDMRVRLLLAEDGTLSITDHPLPPPAEAPRPFRFMLAEERMDRANPLLFHKTTARGFYDQPRQAAAAAHGVDEVVFSNREGELTEGSITSLFLERDGMLLTPALDCGLLPGTLRAELLATGKAREAVLTPADLKGADRIFLGNSVRGLMLAQWIENPLDPSN